jgi:hypothetical protein
MATGRIGRWNAVSALAFERGKVIGDVPEDSTCLAVWPMYPGVSDPRFSRQIEVRVPSLDFSPGVERALERLGYELVRPRGRAEAVDARIVEAGQLSRLSEGATAPVILIGGPRDEGADDPRVVGVVRPPVGLLDLYTLLQIALEAHPREVPRIPTALPARSLREGVDAPGAILSLSEKGGRLRSASRLPGYGSLHLQFMLPEGGPIYTRAEPRQEAGNESGLAFQRLPEVSRAAIAEFVMRSLSAG